MALENDLAQPRRVLLKLSGEAFGNGKVGVDTATIRRIAGEIVPAVEQGVQVAIVTGGGNFFRGAELQEAGIDRSRGDYMGMLGTVMNCLALQDFLEQAGQAIQRSLEIHCDEVLMGKNGVDGVYTADPRKDPSAQRFETLSYKRALIDNLAVMDASAMAMARDNNQTIRVFGLEGEGNVTRALMGDSIGTLVSNGDSSLA